MSLRHTTAYCRGCPETDSVRLAAIYLCCAHPLFNCYGLLRRGPRRGDWETPDRRGRENVSGCRWRRTAFGGLMLLGSDEFGKAPITCSRCSRRSSFFLGRIFHAILPKRAKELARGSACAGHLGRHRSRGGEAALIVESRYQIAQQSLREIFPWWHCKVSTLTGCIRLATGRNRLVARASEHK